MKTLTWTFILLLLCASGGWLAAFVLAFFVVAADRPDINSPFYKTLGTLLYYWRKYA